MNEQELELKVAAARRVANELEHLWLGGVKAAGNTNPSTIIRQALSAQADEIERLKVFANHIEQIGNEICSEKDAEIERLRAKLAGFLEKIELTVSFSGNLAAMVSDFRDALNSDN